MSIFLLFALYFLPSSVNSVCASPLLNITVSGDTSLDSGDPSSCKDLGNDRTVWDIVQSCLALIFSCTWVAIHPNIPGPYESTLKTACSRIRTMIMALVAPELVILWAFRQRIVARKYERQFKHHGWTLTHGFFALMGGFMLFEGDTPIRILFPDDIEKLTRSGLIEFPRITEEEIQDRSKGDLISKGLVVVQSTWFVLQCIARVVKHLPVSELEIMTLAYATLNFATYAIWWNKPLSVQRSFRVYKTSGTGKIMATAGDGGQSRDDDAGESSVDGETLDEGLMPTTPIRPTSFSARTIDNRNVIRRVLTSITYTLSHWYSLKLALSRMYAAPINIFLPMMGLTRSTYGDQTKVSTYHAESGDTYVVGSSSPDPKMTFLVACIAMIFGVIHCIAWSSEFPSHLERILWRTSSLAITCLPLVEALSVTYTMAINQGGDGFWEVQVRILVTTPGIIYIFARLDLLVQAFISLRALPHGVYETVSWTTYIPHI